MHTEVGSFVPPALDVIHDIFYANVYKFLSHKMNAFLFLC